MAMPPKQPLTTAPKSLTEYDYISTYTGAEATPFYFRIVDDRGVDQPLYDKNGMDRFALKMNIGPTSISINMAKIVNRTQTMTAWHEDHWGEELDTITLQGSTAAFVVGTNTRKGSAQTPVDSSIPVSSYGLTTASRSYSISYQEMKTILTAMRSNGAQFATDGLGLVTKRNFVRIAFDVGQFDGYIESFDLSEDSSSPFRMTYTITFKSEKTVFSYM